MIADAGALLAKQMDDIQCRGFAQVINIRFVGSAQN